MALKGIKVLELVGLAPVPFCGQILRDFGARVLRVDNVLNPLGSHFQMFTAGKETMKLNLKSPAGVKIVHQLVAEQQMDVFLDPFRPGVLERLNLGPEKLTTLNPKLIYASISSFGQTGPMKDTAGHDINFVALSGALSRLGPAGGQPPIAPMNLLADFAGGSLLCTIGIMMALFERSKSGLGQVVDLSMTEGTAYLSTFLWETLQKQPDILWPNYPKRSSNMLDGGAPWYRCYETSDGKWMAVGALEEKFYQTFLETIQFTDSQFHQFDVEKWPQFAAKIADIMRTKTRDEWTAIFSQVDACVTPVLELTEAAASELHTAREAFDPTTGLPNPAPKLSRTPAQRSPAPKAGTGQGTVTHAVLRQLGYTEDQVRQFRDEGVIDDPESDED